jgi:hypothetical protein
VTDRWAQTWSQHEHAWREGLREPAPAGCRHIDEVGSALTRRHEVLVEPHDTELEATALAMFLPYRSLSRYYAEFDTGSVGADDWVDSTVPLAGIEFTMDVLSRAQGLIRAGVGDQEAARNNEMGRLWLKNAGSNGNPVASEDPFAGWRALRYHLGAAEEHAYEQARRRAEQLRSTAPLPVRCGLSFAFPEQSDWVAQDAREGLRSDNFVYYGAIVLAGLRDPGLALEVVRDLKGRSKVVEPLTFSFELVRHLEEHAASVLMEMVEAPSGSSFAACLRIRIRSARRSPSHPECGSGRLPLQEAPVRSRSTVGHGGVLHQRTAPGHSRAHAPDRRVFQGAPGRIHAQEGSPEASPGS